VNEDAWAPLSAVADLARVSPGTVRHWRYRGWLDADGRRRHLRVVGRLYNAADALLAERDTRMSGQSHRAMVA
jgi:DNA-binding transcriptional MerR regulator